MSNSQALSRRAVLRGAAFISTGLAVGLVPGLAQADPTLDPQTPRQMQGPYYPRPDQLDARPGALRDNDLCVIPGAIREARGEPILITGRVLGPSGAPIEAALVEIWQACSSGRYLSRRDRRERRQHDPGFQYFGTCHTTASGLFAFRTIVPPSYPSGVLPGWIRPRHIHVRVVAPGLPPFVTQMYFDDPADPQNDEENLRLQRRDLLLRPLSLRDRARLIRPVLPTPESVRPLARLASWENDALPWEGLEADRWVDFPIQLAGERWME